MDFLTTRFRASPLIAFHCGRGRDHKGRRHRDVIRLDDVALLSANDWIPWLFPLAESNAPPPHLSLSDFARLRQSQRAHDRIAAAGARLIAILDADPSWRSADHPLHPVLGRMFQSTYQIIGSQHADALRHGVLRRLCEGRSEIPSHIVAAWRPSRH